MDTPEPSELAASDVLADWLDQPWSVQRNITEALARRNYQPLTPSERFMAERRAINAEKNWAVRLAWVHSPPGTVLREADGSRWVRDDAGNIGLAGYDRPPEPTAWDQHVGNLCKDEGP